MEVNYKELYEATRDRNKDLTEDLAIATAKLGDADWYVGSTRERKIDRQRKALKILNRRVRVQRLQLRRLNELERGLRPDEWHSLKEEFAFELNADDWDID